jgi:hypothetical protein
MRVVPLFAIVNLTTFLSTDTQNWHALQLPNSTAQYELIDMSYHEGCISRFLLICSLMGCNGGLC